MAVVERKTRKQAGEKPNALMVERERERERGEKRERERGGRERDKEGDETSTQRYI